MEKIILPQQVLKLVDAVTGNLLTDFVKLVARKVKNSPRMRMLREKLGLSNVDDLTKDIIALAIARCLDKIDLEFDLKKAVLTDEENAAIIIRWVIDPDPGDPAELEARYAVGEVEKANLYRFFGALPEAIIEAREELFTADSVAILRQIEVSTATIIEEFQEGHEASLQATGQVQKAVDKIGASIKSQHSDIRYIKEMLQAQATDPPDGKGNILKGRLLEIKTLIEENRYELARERAEVLQREVAESEEADKETISKLHSYLADCYLSSIQHQIDAIPHLKTVVELSTDVSAVFRNR